MNVQVIMQGRVFGARRVMGIATDQEIAGVLVDRLAIDLHARPGVSLKILGGRGRRLAMCFDKPGIAGNERHHGH